MGHYMEVLIYLIKKLEERKDINYNWVNQFDPGPFSRNSTVLIKSHSGRQRGHRHPLILAVSVFHEETISLNTSVPFSLMRVHFYSAYGYSFLPME